MINCNPETVSTDYDTSDRLYFEPLTFEDVSAVLDNEKPDGVLVQFGGQTPLKLARALEAAGYPIWGTSPESIDLAEDRGRFGRLLDELGLARRAHGEARDEEEALEAARRDRLSAGRPAVLRARRPRDGDRLRRGPPGLLHARGGGRARRSTPSSSTGSWTTRWSSTWTRSATGRHWIGGIQQHIEKAGIHSGDSFSVLPPWKVTPCQLRPRSRARPGGSPKALPSRAS